MKSHQVNQASAKTEDSYEELKLAVHHRLLESMDLNRANKLDQPELQLECAGRIRVMIDSVNGSVDESAKDQIVQEVLDEVFGLGPLQGLMDDEDISDILVNGPDQVFIERHGKIEQTAIRFRDDEHLLNVIRRIVRHSGRRLDESSPMVDARLPDGSRVNAVIHPVALDGPSLSIRRFRNRGFSLGELVSGGMLCSEMADFLRSCVALRMNIIISGGSGAGKTTLLNALSSSIPTDERVVTIEDAAELKLRQQHVVRLETRPPNVEGAGEITTRDAVRNALRMRPDRILVGECRGAEAFDMLQAMNSGHSGSMTTMHANGPVDAFRRLESMLCMAGMEVPVTVMREYVGSAIDLVVQVERLGSGVRKVMSVAEVRPIEGGAAQIEDIYRFCLSSAANESGVQSGYYEATGCVPALLSRLGTLGLSFPDGHFTARRLESAQDLRQEGLDESR